uniref:Hemocyanin middle domain-containing protein n=1 Tax=Phlebotomus papatasi TaxID=29031 RepID=A0A1B0D917_PHLPP
MNGVDVSLLLVENEDILVIHVRCVPHVLVDFPVEGIAEWQGVHIASTGANSSCDGVVISGVLGYTGWVVGGYNEVELEWHTTLLALGEHQTTGEAIVSLSHVQRELSFARVGSHHPFVEFEVGGAVLYELAEVHGVTDDDVLSNNEIVWEDIQEDEVLTVLIDVVHNTELINLGAKVDTNHRLDSLVRLHGQFDSEGQVVETGLASLDDKVLTLIVSHLSELLHFRHGHLLIVDLNINGVGDVSIELVEVSYELVNLDILNLDTGEVDLIDCVGWQLVLELPVELDDFLVQLVEEWVTHGSFVLFQHTWHNIIVTEVVDGATEEHLGKTHDVLVVAGVKDCTRTVVQILARYYLERLSNDLGHIPEFSWYEPIYTGYYPNLRYYNGVYFPSRPNYYNFYTEENYFDVDTLWTYEQRIRDAIDLGFIYLPDGTHVDLTKPDSIEYLGNLIQSNPDSDIPCRPSRRDSPCGSSSSVKANILSEVGDLLIRSGVNVPAGVVGWDDDGVDIFDLLHAIESLHLVLLSQGDDIAVEEVIGVDFVDGREFKTSKVGTMEDGSGQGVDEHAFVDVETGPDNALVECVPVFGIVEDIEERHNLVLVSIFEHREHFIERKHSVLVDAVEFLNSRHIGIVVEVVLEAECLGLIPECCVNLVLMNML